MTRPMLAAVATLVAAYSVGPQACGDKYLVNSRGTRFERAGFVRPPARVLVFAPTSAPLGQLASTADLEGALTRVGYRPTRVATREELMSAIGGSSWDVIVVDLSDRQVIEGASEAVSASAAIVAVAFAASGDDVQRARREGTAVVRQPRRSRQVVEAIDDVLYRRSLTRQAARAGA